MNTDTLTTAKELEAKGVEHAAAEAIATAIHNHTEAHLEQLATKTDLALAVQQLEARLTKTMYGTTTSGDNRTVSPGPIISGLSGAESANKPAGLAQLIADFPQ